MSGLEVIATISSIIALVEFSQEVLARATELRTSGDHVRDTFQSINDLLPPISHAVRRTKERINSKEIDEDTCAALVPIHRGVERTLEEVKTVLEKYTPEENASKVEVLWKAGKSVFQEKKVKGILQRLHEYVGVLTLSHAEAASAGTFSPIEKADIQRILGNIAHSSTIQAASLPRKCRNLLSLDGGGLRGLSILYILDDLMAKVNENQDPLLKPCEVFDLIGGSGTGGLIAIMLGRLGMTVEECTVAYLQLFQRLSTKHDETIGAEHDSLQMINSGILRSTVSELIQAQGLLPDSKFHNDENISCYTFVCATAKSTNTIVHFQNYVLPGERDRRPATIVDAACATLSSAKIFEAVQFGMPPSKYVAGELGANNPIDRVWNEAQRIWSKKGGLEQLVSCVISVGAGSPPSRTIHTDGPGFTDAMYDIAMQTEETAKKFILGKPELGGRDKRYHRFNVYNLADLGWESYGESEVIVERVNDYLEGHTEEVEQCAERLQRNNVVQINVQQIHKYYEVSRTLVNHFVGREEILSQIDDYFSTTDVTRPKVLILHALGGQGKSQIALKYCQMSKESHQGIFWINASSEITTRDAFDSIANALGGIFLGEGGDLEQKIRHVRNTLELWTSKWILVFDNYDWPGEFTIENMNKYFPISEHGKIIITSRNQNLNRFGKLLEVPAMSRDEGLKLLIRDPAIIQANQVVGTQIVNRLGGLALAIDQAAAYIKYRRMAIENFLPTYEDQRKKILQYTPLGWEYSTMQVYGRAEKEKALSAFTTWEMSFQQLRPDDLERQESAGHFLTLCAFLDYLNVEEDLHRTYLEWAVSPPEWLTILFGSTEEDSNSDSDSDSSFEDNSSSDEDSLARSYSSNEQSRGNGTTQSGSTLSSQDVSIKKTWKSNAFWDLREKCVELSLLRVQDDNDQSRRNHQTFSLHPLIRDWLQFRVEKDKRRTYCEEAINIVAASIESFQNQNTTAVQKMALLAHMDACISNDRRFSKKKKTLGLSNDSTAITFGNMYCDQGRWKEAEDLEVQVVEMRKRVLGQEHPSTLTSMANLASTYRNQGRWKEAEDLDMQVMEMSLRVLGQEHPDTLTSIANLASTYRKQGRWKEAEDLDMQVMETRKRVLGQEHPDTLTSIANLASTYRNQGRWKEAEDLDMQVMETRKRVSGQEHPDTLTSIANLASTFWKQGRWKEAEDLDMQVTETRKRVLGQEHPDTLASMANLAFTWKDQGYTKKALVLMEECTKLQKRCLGIDHPDAQSSQVVFDLWQEEELTIASLRFLFN